MRFGIFALAALTACSGPYIDEGSQLDPSDEPEAPGPDGCTAEMSVTGEPSVVANEQDYGVWQSPITLDNGSLAFSSGYYQPNHHRIELSTGHDRVIDEGYNTYVMGRARDLGRDVAFVDNKLVVRTSNGEVLYELRSPDNAWLPPMAAFEGDRIAISWPSRESVMQLVVHDLSDEHDVLRMTVPLVMDGNGVGAIALSADGSTVALASNGDERIAVVGIADGQVQTLDGHPFYPNSEVWTGPVLELALNASGEQLLSVGHDQTLRRWNTRTGNELLERPGLGLITNQNIYAPWHGRAPVAWSADDQFYAWMHADQTVRVARACDDADLGLRIESPLNVTDWYSGLPYALRVDPESGWLVALYEGAVQAWPIQEQ